MSHSHTTSGKNTGEPVAAPAPVALAPDEAVAAPADDREQFIPLRKRELVERLLSADNVPTAEAEAFREFCRALAARIHHDFYGVLDELKEAYAPFDPDSDTPPRDLPNAAVLEQRRGQVFDRFRWLLERGNFKRLAEDEINAALDERSHWGLNLKVDFEVFERLEVFCRGDTRVQRFRRSARGGFRKQSIDVPVFQRLVLIFRFRKGRPFSKYLDTDDVYIKLFKEIPKADLDMLLPGTKVQMSLTDRAKIILPTFSGLSIAAAKAFFAFGPAVGMWGLVGGTLGYGVRSVYGYMNTRQKYQLNLTQSLYFQNIDNNAGVIHRVVDEAEEQDAREALLAYYFLLRHAPAAGWSVAELDTAIEAFLAAQSVAAIDFEVADALDKLSRWELARRVDGDRWQAVPIGSATEKLSLR